MFVDYAEEIKNRVDLIDLVKLYGFNPVNKRIQCPFHHGEKRNLSIKNNSYKCFVCGEHGDAISFVQKYFNLDFKSAISKINDDMMLFLPIVKKLSPWEKFQLNRIAEQRKEKISERERTIKKLEKEYYNWMDDWIMLDRVVRDCAPETPDEKMSEAYIYALKKIDYVEYRLDCAKMELYELQFKNN